jgi:hypothetical protein
MHALRSIELDGVEAGTDDGVQGDAQQSSAA